MSGTRSYVLPLVALIETLKGMSTSVTLRAQLPIRSKIWKETCFAEVVIEAGELLSCDIRTADDQKLLFSASEAFTLLQELGPLKWQLVASGRRELSPQELSRAQQPFPSGGTIRRSAPRKVLTSLPPAQFKALPQRHKQVFLLIDGRKDSAEIARLLSIPPNSVESILSELYRLRLITFRE